MVVFIVTAGITRARRELSVTWNTGRRDDDLRQAAAPFWALYTY